MFISAGSLVQAGVLSRGTPRRILKVHLPSEPYRYLRLPQAAKMIIVFFLSTGYEVRNISSKKNQPYHK